MNVRTAATSSEPLRLDWASHEAAKYACARWHYSKSIPPPPHVRVGVWEYGRFVGVVLFARGASAPLLKPYGLTHSEGCELVRVALREHETPVTRIVAIAIRMLRKAAPGLRLIVSFADPSRGHHGGIYQGGNWIYAGTTAGSTEYVGPDGKQWHSRMVSATGVKTVFGRKRRVYRTDECIAVRMPGKHRYLYPLDEAMRQSVIALSKSYPKRARAEVVGAESPPLGVRPDPRAPI